jgi:hypothetical protein
VADAMEQDFSGRLPNSCVPEGDILAGSWSEPVSEDDLKAERSRNVYDSHAICVQLYRPPRGISTMACIP